MQIAHGNHLLLHCSLAGRAWNAMSALFCTSSCHDLWKRFLRFGDLGSKQIVEDLWWGRKVEFFSCGQCSSVEAVVHIDKRSYYFGCCLKENEKISTSDLFQSWTVCTNVQTMYTLRSLVFKSPAMSIICSTLMEVSWKTIARQEGSSLHAICDSNFLFFYILMDTQPWLQHWAPFNCSMGSSFKIFLMTKRFKLYWRVVTNVTAICDQY